MDRPGEFNILHPLASIQWREACRLPVKMRDVQSVMMGHNVIVGGGVTPGGRTADATVYEYDINRDYWGIHSIAPTYRSALTTYRSQLVLAGGMEVASGSVTNSVTNSVRVFENGEWCPSIPAMTVARRGASAVSRGQHLIVAGGGSTAIGDYTDIVEVFDGRSWSTAQSLPRGCVYMKSVVYNDVWYVCGGGKQGCEVYSAPLQSIVKSTRDTQSTVWTKLPPTPHPFSSIAIFGQQLLTIGGGWSSRTSTSAVHAFSPHSQSWPHVGNLPVALHTTSSLTLPNGELMTLGGNTDTGYSDRVFIGQLGVQSYHPDSQFSISAIERLSPVTGVDIFHQIGQHSSQFIATTQLSPSHPFYPYTDNRSYGKMLTTDWLSGGKSPYPSQWKLFYTALRGCGLNELANKIEHYLRTAAKVERGVQTGRETVEHSDTSSQTLDVKSESGDVGMVKREFGDVEMVKSEVKSEPVPSPVSADEVGQMHIKTEPQEEEEPLSAIVTLQSQNTEWMERCQELDEKVLELEAELRKKAESEQSLEESGEGGKAGQEKGSWEAENSPEKMCAPIRGADIVATTTVTLAAGEGYEWKGHGLRLTVPAHALEPLSPPATITIQASLSGHYHLPDHTQLVSGVYWISFPGKFPRPVTLEVQHCASLQPAHEMSSLTFVTAKCTQETLPYNLKPMTGGVFSADSRFATIELSHFSGFAVVNGDSENKRYTAHTYYISRSPTTWHMHFAIICKLDLFLQALREFYSREEAEPGPYLEVAFDRDEVALEVEEDGVTLDNGWSLVPLFCPTSVLRESVDSYKPGEPVPSCQLELYWTKREQPPGKLKHRVKLTGVRRHTSITITRDPAHPDTSKLPDSRKRPGSQHGEVEVTSSKRLRQRADGDSAGPSTAHTVPAATDGTTSWTKSTRNALDIGNLFDVKSELIPVAGEWRNIGLALRLDDSQLGVIQRDNPDVNGRLTDMLRQWLNKTYDVEQFGQPSWQMLVEAVRSPAGGNNPALAAQIDEKHGGQ